MSVVLTATREAMRTELMAAGAAVSMMLTAAGVAVLEHRLQLLRLGLVPRMRVPVVLGAKSSLHMFSSRDLVLRLLR